MNLNRIRPYTTIILLIAWILIALTGLTLYLIPHGPASRNWVWLGVSKHEFKDIHFYLGILAVLLVSFHGYLNVRALKKYFTSNKRILSHPLLWATVVVSVIVAVALISY